MIKTFSLTPGFSPVTGENGRQNRFNGFFRPRQAVETADLFPLLRHPAEAGC
jgi:hypothetical protein